ncbi:hypothetical protein [Cloacibacterium sp.]|uniref:hypothetical protein n=1 Tax=Cloacibacterium sp. TaxID=1913682 RepID=UPI0039E64D0A
MTKEINLTLYRYDISKPPTNWDTDFLSCEYDTEEHGHKNKAELFFFTDSLDIANDLGKCSAKKHSKPEYFLTTTKTQKLKLIDFSNRFNIYQMLCLLHDLCIDVLTSDFKTYENNNHFGQLKNIFEAAEKEADSKKKFDIIKNLKVHSNSNYEHISLFGQRLTDFDNGLHFKKLVKEKYSDIDGYLWREFNDNRGFTYCLFESRKLCHKKTININIES